MSTPKKSARTAAQRASDTNREAQIARNGMRKRDLANAPGTSKGPGDQVAYRPQRNQLTLDLRFYR